MTRDDVLQVLREALASHAMTNRGSVWQHSGPEVHWVLHLDRLPHGNRLAIDVGAALIDGTGRLPARATDCPLVMHAENMALGDAPAVMPVVDLDSSLADEDRRVDLERIARALGVYVADRGTLDALRRAYRAGELRSAFIDKAVREVLEA